MVDRMLEMAAVILLVSGSMSLTGCVEEEVRDPNVDLAVRNAAVDGDHCLRSDTIEFQTEGNERCHEVTVQVANGNQQEDLDTASIYWSAVASTGGVFDAADKTGPDAVAAGGQAEVTLLFTVPETETLESIRYEYVWMDEPVETSIPSYSADADSEEEGPEQASATAKGLDTDDNGDVDAIRATLTSGENAPYRLACEGGDPCSGAYREDTQFRMEGSDGAGNPIDAASLHEASGLEDRWGDGDEWDVGEAIYIDCGGAGTAELFLNVTSPSSPETTILDTTIQCDE